MGVHSFLASRRWLGIIALALVVAVSCTLLGRWQFHRYEGKAELVDLVTSNYEAEPVPLTDLVRDGSQPMDPDDEWHPVQVTGSFVGSDVILPQRGVQGSAGDHVLGVLEADEPMPGQDTRALVIVDRGWYPPEAEVDTSAPTGQVTVAGRLRPAEPASSRGIRAQQVFQINPAQVTEAADIDDGALITSTYVMSMPGPAQEGLDDFVKPEEDLGPHLSYAFQWWTFGVGALVGLGVLIRREARMEAGQAPVRKKQRDADAEDALIDAQIPEDEWN